MVQIRTFKGRVYLETMRRIRGTNKRRLGKYEKLLCYLGRRNKGGNDFRRLAVAEAVKEGPPGKICSHGGIQLLPETLMPSQGGRTEEITLTFLSSMTQLPALAVIGPT